MNHDEKRSSTRPRAATLGFTVGIVLLTAACGGSPSSTASSSSSASGRQSQALAFSQCMRSHGVADFPDPDANGRFPSSASATQTNPNFGTASSACRHLIPTAGSNGPSRKLGRTLQIAQCMRTHGVPNYPDPNGSVDPGAALSQAGINTNSPQFQSAARTCDQLYPWPSASAGNGSGS